MPHLRSIKKYLSENSKRLLDVSIKQGVSNWLLALLISDFGFELSKQHFSNAIRLRYGWSIATLSTTCPCGARLSMQHCMSCKKGSFVSIRHNDLRDLTAKMLSKVYKDIVTKQLTRYM